MGADKYILKGLGREKAIFLTKDSTSLCVKVTKEQNITISPIYIGSVCDGIAERLESQINEYDPELKGIVLAYEDINLISSEASLIADRPFLYLKVKVTYIVFQPQIGSILTGIIKELKESHVVCVVHEIFNATIFQSPTLAWNVSMLKLGDHLPFEVTEISKNTKIFFLKGKLASPPVCQSSTDTNLPEEQINLITLKKTEDNSVMAGCGLR